jgi:hypothetical protein
MNSKLLRSATLSLCAAAGATLAVAFLPHGVAAADNEDDLFWNNGVLTDTSSTTIPFGDLQAGDIQVTGSGPLDAYDSPADVVGTPVLTDELQANATLNFVSWASSQGAEQADFATYDITQGDAAIPTDSVIDWGYFQGFAAETVEVPDAGLFGLPEITETLFTPFGDFSF